MAEGTEDLDRLEPPEERDRKPRRSFEWMWLAVDVIATWFDSIR